MINVNMLNVHWTYVLVCQPLCLFLFHQVSQTADNDNHLYDEIVTEYSLVGLARDADSTVIYSTVQHCDPAPQNDENDLYSLIMQYWG